MDGTEFYFKTEVDWLPFKLNIRKEANLSQEQRSYFISLIYDNKEVFSLHEDDLGYCDQLKHTTLTTKDKPVFLPHFTIPMQLQGEAQKCLEAWFHQAIIQPSQSPYASHVVIVHKKLEEIHLHVNYHKLNSIMVRDAFPLPHIDKAL